MRKHEVIEAIHTIIQTTVQNSGGDWKKGFRREVELILLTVGKLSPEPGSGNIRRVAPNYNSHLIKKVGRKRVDVSPELRAKAREILRQMGML